MRSLLTRGLLSIALAFACVGLAVGQSRTVTGTVTDEGTGDPLPGVSVVVQGTTTGTITDMEGEYSVSVPGDDAVLVFSYVGYVTQEVPVSGQSDIDVTLAEDTELLEEVVVVGYGEQRREAVTGSVATIDADDIEGAVVAPTQMIQGRVPGVNIVQNSGEPGSGIQIRVRGGTSISASNEPLYVVDGVPIDNTSVQPGGVGTGGAAGATRNPLNLINPNDIATITVLKDASATAIYGSRGANGVVLIETKQGRAGQVRVDYEGYVSSSRASNTLDLASAAEYRSVVETAVANKDLGYTKNDAGEDVLVDDDGNGVADVIDRLGSVDTDWEEAVLRNAVSNFHNLALSGGLANTQYRASVSYLNQEGIVQSSGLERVTGRLNANTSALSNRLRFDLNVQTAYVEDDYAPLEESSGFEGGLISNVISFNPTYPVLSGQSDASGETYFEIGTGRQGVRNPVALLDQLADYGKTTRTLGNIGGELDLLTGLTLRVNVGADRFAGSRRIYQPRTSPIGAEYNGRALQREREGLTRTFQSYLTYNLDLARNHFDILGGYEFNDYLIEEFGAEARDFITDYWEYNNLGGGAAVGLRPYSFKEKNRLISFFGRANYSFSDRYFLQGVLRYDGSSRFGTDNKWGLFPAVSAAWRISEEAFMNGVDAVSDLRLRVGYGIVGSQEIQNYRSLALLRPEESAGAVLGGVFVPGVNPVTFGNPDLKWEETASFNVGLDFGFLNNKYSGTLEFYQKDTDNLLLEVPLPQPAVVGTRFENIGSVRNRGVEASFDALVLDDPDKNLTLGLVFSTNDNEIVSLGDREQIFSGSVSGRGQSGVNSLILQPGHAVPTFYGPVFAGFDENGTQLFEDLDGDGTVEINSDDRTYLGSPLPDWSLGFNTRANVGSFDFNLFLRGEFGRELFNNTALVFQNKNSTSQGQNFLAGALTDPDAFGEASTFSSRWVENASFLRLDNVTIGYRLPLTSITEHVRNARIYVTGQNLITVTPYDGYDPEVNTGDTGLASAGIDWMRYPRSRTFTVGVNLGF